MPKNLTPRQKIAVQSLAAGQSVTQTAVSTGVSRESVYRWLDNPTFTRAIDEAQDDAIATISRRLTVLGVDALNVLRDVLADPHTPAGAKIRAADIVLAKLLTVREIVDIERRLTALERGANET